MVTVTQIIEPKVGGRGPASSCACSRPWQVSFPSSLAPFTRTSHLPLSFPPKFSPIPTVSLLDEMGHFYPETF